MLERIKNNREYFVKVPEPAKVPLFGIFVILVLLIVFSNLHFGLLLVLAMLFWSLVMGGFRWDYRKSLFIGMAFLAVSPIFLILDLTSVAEKQCDLAFFFLLFGVLQNLLFGEREL